MLPLPHRPAHLSQDGTPNLPPFPGPDSYYSAKDIEILHHVVVTAQGDLETLPEGERLATNALFRAYDVVLPRYGIDPEQDHHLSRLIFRIGGERGDESLFDKFRAVLSRMGIELEFEAEVSTSSLHTMSGSGSRNSAPTELRQHGETPLRAKDSHEVEQQFFGSIEAAYISRQNFASPRPAALRETSPGVREDWYDRAAQESSTKGSIGNPKNGTNPSSRAMFSQGQDAHNGSIGTATPQPTLHLLEPLSHEQRKEPVLNHHPPSANHQPISTVALQSQPSISQEPLLHHHQPGDKKSRLGKGPSPVTSMPVVDEDEHEVHSQLQRRASRAWGLFQLTKAVSHWNVWAEEKLDRAEVARRHMTRYRHFGSWRDTTLDVKLYSRRLLLVKGNSVWQLTVEETHNRRGLATASFDKLRIQQCLAHWASLTRALSSAPARHGSPHLLCDTVARWRACVSQFRALGLSAKHTKGAARAEPALAGWHDLLRLHEHASSLRRHQLLRGVLYHWEIVRRSREFAIVVADEDVRRIVAHWRTLGQGRDTVRHDVYQDRHGARVSVRRDGSDVLASTRRHNLLGDFLSKWRLETSGSVASLHGAASLSTFLSAHRAIYSWQSACHGVDTLHLWAGRADRYLAINACLKNARQAARPSWSHTTRTLYARARWRQKHLNVRRLLSSWKRQARSIDRLDAVARDSEVDSSARRLIQTLHAWQEECEGLLASDWSSHLPGSWINEWAVSDELLQLLQDEASAAWEACLRSKIYNKWRALSVQFHSQSYVVSDVVEKNSRKLTKRILLHWQQSGSGTTHSLASHTASRSTHNPRTSIWSRAQTRPTATSSLMEFGGVQSLEESSLYNAEEQHGVLDTPTRWTGLSSSLARLPTTTPRAPLSTPFERELRTRYSQGLGSAFSSLPPGQTPRLSAADARRIAEGRRHNRPS